MKTFFRILGTVLFLILFPVVIWSGIWFYPLQMIFGYTCLWLIAHFRWNGRRYLERLKSLWLYFLELWRIRS